MHRRRLLHLSVAVSAAIIPAVLVEEAGAFVDKDCADFRSQRAAQRYFNRQRRKTGVRDKHRLDDDGDGVACESNS